MYSVPLFDNTFVCNAFTCTTYSVHYGLRPQALWRVRCHNEYDSLVTGCVNSFSTGGQESNFIDTSFTSLHTLVP